jgi:hypothetical protein
VFKFSDILWLYGINPTKIARKELVANMMLIAEGHKRGLRIAKIFNCNSDPLIYH